MTGRSPHTYRAYAELCLRVAGTRPTAHRPDTCSESSAATRSLRSATVHGYTHPAGHGRSKNRVSGFLPGVEADMTGGGVLTG